MSETIESSSESEDESSECENIARQGHTLVMPSKYEVVPRKTILARKTAILNPILSDATRRTKLGMRLGETKGRLNFVVQRSKLLVLPPTPKDDSETSRALAAARETLCRRCEVLHPSRRENDAAYIEAVEQGTEVIVIAALPRGYTRGGWRCHTKTKSHSNDQVECFHPNGPTDVTCMKCQSPKPSMRPEFSYLRLITPGVRRQRILYTRTIQGIDNELERCDVAERQATEKLAEFDRLLVEQKGKASPNSDKAKSLPELSDMEESLMMDMDLVSQVWQRMNARTLLPMLVTRKLELSSQLSKYRGELAVMIQSTFELAVPHLQRLTRRFLVRLRLDGIRMSANDFARLSAAVEIQRLARSKAAFKEAERRHKLRDHYMAIRIQCAARCKASAKERRRLYEIHVEKVKNNAAALIQSIFRCFACKLQAELLAAEKIEQLGVNFEQNEEQEKALVEFVQNDSAIIIQKHCRRVLALNISASRRIELGLHLRVSVRLCSYLLQFHSLHPFLF